MSVMYILTALGQALLLAALAFALVCLLISHLRFKNLAGPRTGSSASTDTLTVALARRMGTAHRTPEPFALLLVGATEPLDAAAWSDLELRLRDRLRDGDDVLRHSDQHLAVVAPASRAAIPSLVERLLDDEPRANVVRIGAAAYPEDGQRTDELRKQAEAAWEAARTSEKKLAWPPGATPPAPPAPASHTGVAEKGAPDPKSLLDETTGVLKSERLGPALQKFVAQYRREDRPVSVVCLDVDGLRRYNDQYGRSTGDRLLRAVADLLQRITREEDLIARFEEDQFVVAMSAKPDQALAEAQRLLNGLRRTTFKIEGYSLRLTATLGVAGYPDHGSVAKALFEAAQAALQTAKAKGRNQCLLYQPGTRKPEQIGASSDTF